VPFNSTVRYIYQQHSIPFICVFDISQWAWNQRYLRMLHIYFVFKYIIEIEYSRQINDITLRQTGWFQFLHRQLSLFHLHMVLELAADTVCKSVFNTRSVSDKQVDVTEFSTVSSTGSFPQILRL
jgi:hypothetical protein